MNAHSYFDFGFIRFFNLSEGASLVQRRWLSIAILASVLAVVGCQSPGTAPTVGQAVSNPAQKASVSFSVAVGRAGYALKQLGGYKVEDVARINAHVHNQNVDTNTPAASPMASAWNVLPANGVFKFTLGNLDYGTRYWLRLEALRADGTVIGVIDEYSPGKGSPQTYTDANNQRFQWFETLGATQNQLQVPVDVLIKLADVVYSGQAPVQIGFINGGFARAAGPVTITTPTPVDVSPTPSPIPSSETLQYVVSTLAGSGIQGYIDGPSLMAQFSYPAGVIVDNGGNVYVADRGNHRIRKLAANGDVSTFAGCCSRDFLWDFADGPASEALFGNPVGLAIDNTGNIYVADSGNHRIRKVSPNGYVSTVAGFVTNRGGGFADGPSNQAEFRFPSGVAVDVAGNVYVADTQNHRIRKIATTGDVTTFSGSGVDGFMDGPSHQAQFDSPFGVALDAAGNVFITETIYGKNGRIRRASPAGYVSTLQGVTTNTPEGDADYVFNMPYGVTVDGGDNVFVSDFQRHRVIKLSPVR